MSQSSPPGGGGDKPGRPPQKTVIAPLPGGRGGQSSQGAQGGQGNRGGQGDQGGVWSPAGGATSDRGSGGAAGSSGARPLPWSTPQGGQGSPAPSQSPQWPASGGTGPASLPPASAGGQHAWMGSTGQDQFFPDMSRPDPTPQAAPIQKIPLERALQGTTTGHSAGNNPLTAAAAGLLMLLGRLRSQVVDLDAMPLMSHVTREIDEFEDRARTAGADPQQAQVAKYVLCGTADDIVQNLPGTDRDVWVQYAMEARFFNRRTSGVGIFQEIERALGDPARCYDLLELMLICLQLGFQGQYRGAPGGDVDLQHMRRRVYETLRRVRARDDDDISPHWEGIATPTHHQRGRVPLWIIASLVLAVLCGGYIGMRVYLAGDAGQVADRMRDLHPGGTIALARASTLPSQPVDPEPYKPPEFDPPDQLERIRDALSRDIEAGNLTADTRGNFIAVTANNLVLFDTGSADIQEDFVPIAGRIAEMLQEETGDVRIVGHTDNVPMSGTGRYRNNQELSVARAESVAEVIRQALENPDRIEVVGAGPDDPIARNDSADGRAKNRRVEILIRREEGGQ